MKKVIFREIPFDQYTPITVYHAIAGKGSCLLESAPKKDRYSFVGIEPIASISGTGDYATALRTLRKDNPLAAHHPLALYAGGCIGYVTYEGDYFFQIYQSGVSFDHQKGRAVLFTIDDEKRLDELEKRLKKVRPLPESSLEIGLVSVDKSDEEYAAMVQRAKGHLRAGDVFQIVLSRTFQAPAVGDPFQFYRALRKISPAPYLFFFDFDSFALAGASPEKIISVQGREVESMPIAGTRKKGSLASEFLDDPKEMAEHVMLVDLARNDVGVVSHPGTVKLAEFRSVHEFSHVDHIVSRVVGTLRADCDALDAFQASFPAGTLTGAPKIRAMELIEEIEDSPRGFYGGAIVALDAKGNLATCIAIRMAVFKEGKLSVRAGAGIVLDSDPEKEAEETVLKASAILEAAYAFNHR